MCVAVEYKDCQFETEELGLAGAMTEEKQHHHFSCERALASAFEAVQKACFRSLLVWGALPTVKMTSMSMQVAATKAETSQ